MKDVERLGTPYPLPLKKRTIAVGVVVGSQEQRRLGQRDGRLREGIAKKRDLGMTVELGIFLAS